MWKKCGSTLFLLALSACVTLSTPRQRVDGVDGELIVGNYDGPECGEVFQAKNARSSSTKPSDDRDAHVLLVACDWARRGVPKIHPRHARDAHLEFDDRRFSHVLAGQIVWACTVAKTCAQSFHPKYGTMLAISESSGGDRVEDLGLSVVYANMLDTTKIRAELQGGDLPTAAIDAFVEAVEKARTHVLAKASDLGEFKPVAVDLPLAVHRERQSFFADHAEPFQQLETLAQSLGDPATTAQIEALRSSHMSSCGTIACVSDPLYVEATILLIKSHIAQNDLVSAYAENHRLMQRGGWVAGFAQAVYQRQATAAAEARVAFDKVEDAKGKGLDDDTIAAAVGVAPARFTYASTSQPKTSLPNYTTVLGEPPSQESGFVQLIAPRGETVVVSFKPSQVETLESYGCVETNRIDRITRNGRIEYRKHCNYRKKMVSVPGPKPVTLPSMEVSKLQPGDLLSFFRSAKVGRVYEGRRGDDLVQVRLDPIKPVCRTAKCLEEADGPSAR